jgi:Tol biopolymer transport system component
MALVGMLPWALTLALLAEPAWATVSGTRLVSASQTGVQGNARSIAPVLSEDGTFVAFTAYDDLVPLDTNGWPDIYVKNLTTGVLELISVGRNTVPANGPSHTSAITGDGRYVVFSSEATNLVVGDTTTAMDIFRRDRTSGQTVLVSRNSAGVQANLSSIHPAISSDGRFVTFSSIATNVVPGTGSSLRSHVYIRDLSIGATALVSHGYAAGTVGNSSSYEPAISADGRYVAFHSSANNLVAGDSGGTVDVFVYDRQTAIILRVSQTAAGARRISVGAAGAEAHGDSEGAAISPDGGRVAFTSTAPDIVADSNGTVGDVFSVPATPPSLAITQLDCSSDQSRVTCDVSVIGVPSASIEWIFDNVSVPATGTHVDQSCRTGRIVAVHVVARDAHGARTDAADSVSCIAEAN